MITKKTFPQGIQATKNYDMFSTVEGNREIDDAHVAGLTVSILTKNLLAQNPILVNERLQVIDGQHRLMVAKNNNLEIFYIVVPGASIEEVELLNIYNRKWNIHNFINKQVALGNPHYLWLVKFMQDYTLSLTNALILVYGGDHKWTYKMVRQGKFAVNDEQKRVGLERADILWDMRPYITKKGFLPKAFLKALVDKYDQGVGRKLANEIVKRGKPFVPSSMTREAKMQLNAYL